jgi:hypothetical protein
MSISIESPSGHRLAEIKRMSVHGLPGVGGYTLAINLHFIVAAPVSETFLDNLSIRIDWGDNKQRMLGNSIPEQAQPISIKQYDNEKTVTFRLLLLPSQIEAIEALRNAGDVHLSIWLIGRVVNEGKSGSIQQQSTFKVSQQEWVEALNRMEYSSSFLFELTLPFSANQKEPAVDIIKKAQYHLMRGHYDECVGECRKLLEAYPHTAEDTKALKSARSKLKGDQAARETMDLPERMLSLRDALTNATHLAHHHNLGDGYSRDQARTILGCTVSLLSAFSYKDLI